MPSEEEFSALFEEAMKRSSNGPKAATATATAANTQKTPQLDMSQDEQKKFLSAMQNPEFRSLLNEYMAEISDPANRTETEQYLSQLENEQKVPEDKLLVRPVPGFVVKAKWSEDGEAAEMSQKMFVNVCSSDKMQPPSSTPVNDDKTGKRGSSWHLPYSVGPERLEKDKGSAMVLTFDVCFHPTTLGFAKTQRTYRDMVVKTCIDAVEGVVRDTRRKPQAAFSREYHVLKGVSYKSGEPVTMCIKKPSAEQKPAAAVKSSNAKAIVKSATNNAPVAVSSITQDSPKEKPIDVIARKTNGGSNEALKLDFEDKKGHKADSAELLKEVSSTKKPISTTTDSVKKTPSASVTPSLKKIAFKLVYRGKFELLNHMQAEHENLVPVERNRPKELVVEMEFPSLTNAAGIDLDVSEHTLKLTTKGYDSLDLKLPFPVFEVKGTAKFDKKARKLVVTLPVQPPPEPKSKSVSLAVEEDDDEEEDHGLVEVLSHDKPIEVHELEPTSKPQDEPKTTEPVTKTKAREDDGFAMLRETAIMVQHDPHYLPRASSTPEPDVVPAALIEMYDDLPPLESCSEDDDDDLVLVDSPTLPQERQAEPPAVAIATAATANEPSKPAPFTKKETPTCLSFIVDIADIDAASVLLEFPSTKSFLLRFKAPAKANNNTGDKAKMKLFELKIDSLDHEIESSQAEFDVASENMVVILKKKQAKPAIVNTKNEELSPAPVPTASIAPIVRFQNQFLYELD